MAWISKDFEEIMRPSIDNIYKEIFGDKLIEISRSNRTDNERNMFMDMELAIDTTLIFSNGSCITLQEKSLQYIKKKYNQLTYEYYNDRKKGLKGDWFNLVSQLYFFGYGNANEIGYFKYWIVDMVKLRLYLLKYSTSELESFYKQVNPSPAKADFFGIPFEELEQVEGLILYKNK